MVTPNEKYRQDEDGQWWYYFGSKGLRTRAVIKVCGHCGEDYVIAHFHSERSKFCCQRCSGQAVAKKRTYPRGADDIRWRGGRTKPKGNGYVMLYRPDHPKCSKKRYVMEHRVVMEEQLGRLLESYEHVHHINGIKHDNRIENLELWRNSHPHGVRAHDKHCPTCTCGEEET